MKKLYISEPHERNQSYLNSSDYQNYWIGTLNKYSFKACDPNLKRACKILAQRFKDTLKGQNQI